MTDSRGYSDPRVAPAGDRAIVVELGEGIDEAVNQRVHRLARVLDLSPIAGVVDLIPTYQSLLVCYDPMRISFGALTQALVDVARTADTVQLPKPRSIEIPTLYGGEVGPDLPSVAQNAGLTEQQVIDIHSSGEYTVYMMGFIPGFVYLGGMSDRIATPRLKTPRTAVPAGSVGIAQQQTGIYPAVSPGGWQLIGRTSARLFDPYRNPPTLIGPGDKVHFTAVVGSGLASEHFARPAPAGTQVADVQNAGRQDLTPVIEVVEPGALTTVQDRGRYGFQRYGVPVAGGMDEFALRVANLLVGNDDNAAALEITLTGPELRFLRDAVVALAGADMNARVDGRALPAWNAHEIHAGSVLSFRGLRRGARAYLAVAGGIDVPIVLGSRSTYTRSAFGGLNGRPLRAGDRLSVGNQHRLDFGARSGEINPGLISRMPDGWSPTYLGSHRVRVVLGPQSDAFTSEGIRTLLSSAYTVGAQSDRMGYRLEGPPIEHRTSADVVSDGSPAGAVQVPGDGMPLVLLADRGTTGGYAKIATVISTDLPKLAQAQPGDRVFFDAVSVDEAHDALRKQEEILYGLR